MAQPRMAASLLTAVCPSPFGWTFLRMWVGGTENDKGSGEIWNNLSGGLKSWIKQNGEGEGAFQEPEICFVLFALQI